MTTIASSITDLVGSTPLVRINRMGVKGVELIAKLESANPAFSVKDRVAVGIVDAAEASGDLKPGGTIVEATSGNTGIALAMVGAARGYRVVITMPESMSLERRALMRRFGAELILTPASEGMKGTVEAAEKIVSERDNAILASQFVNKANPAAHEGHTGPEIWEATDGNVDIFVGGVGTGGTISGVGRYLKGRKADVRIVAVEPAESPLLSEGKAAPHGIQGIGANFVPDNLDRDVVDEVVTVTTEQAIERAREAAAREGLLVGISAGAALAGALRVASRPENVGKRIVVLLPDTGERYVTSALFADIMD